MLCLAQYSRRVIPLLAKPSTMLRISCLLRIPPFSTASLAQSRWVPQTLTLQRLGFQNTIARTARFSRYGLVARITLQVCLRNDAVARIASSHRLIGSDSFRPVDRTPVDRIARTRNCSEQLFAILD